MDFVSTALLQTKVSGEIQAKLSGETQVKLSGGIQAKLSGETQEKSEKNQVKWLSRILIVNNELMNVYDFRTYDLYGTLNFFNVKLHRIIIIILIQSIPYTIY